MKHTKISIAGDLGSGKSTIARLLAGNIHCKRYSTGDIQREIAKKLRMSTLELNRYMENDTAIDDDIDEFNKNLNLKEESFVIDSRMAWHFIPRSFKIFLKVDPNISAERVFRDSQRTSEHYADINKAKNELLHRKKSENDRFQSLYRVDCSDMNNYDLVVDTTYSNPKTIVNKILSLLKQWSENKEFIKFWSSPKILFPTKSIGILDTSANQEICGSIQQNGFKSEFPVEVLNLNNFDFIYDGHLRVSASILADIGLIPLSYRAQNNWETTNRETVTEYIKSKFKISYVRDWEKWHKFKYPTYPEL
ncbi:MAG: cytidylate kinase family protein [Desulfobacterales bacterium]|jgi:cytidylate kinase